MTKPHDIFNHEEQIKLLYKAIAKAERATAFWGNFLIAFLTAYLAWQYFLR